MRMRTAILSLKIVPGEHEGGLGVSVLDQESTSRSPTCPEDPTTARSSLLHQSALPMLSTEDSSALPVGGFSGFVIIIRPSVRSCKYSPAHQLVPVHMGLELSWM